MRPQWFLVLILLSTSAVAYDPTWSWITGAASTQRDTLIVSLYHGGDPVGTANPTSEGRAKAIAAGQTLRVNMYDARRDDAAYSGQATITIRDGNSVVLTLAADIVDGQGLLLVEIPLSWSGNYHLDVSIETASAQNEFKVEGLGCHATQESCDGLDNDCDGIVDDIDDRLCGSSDVGVCARGAQSCVNGYWTACANAVEPDIESCDGKDNDCDGRTDESLRRGCGDDGCIAGTQVCSAGTWSSCSSICEDDCSATPAAPQCVCEEGQTRGCGSAVGACQAGIQECTQNHWGACSGVGPTAELCNGIDDDCDGSIDDDIVELCGHSDFGACTFGERTCDDGAWGQCSGAVYPSEERCNGVDDDCDGQIDESIARACGSGGCTRGRQYCSLGAWGACSDTSGPTTEYCNAVDDNCDGRIDEGLVQSCGSDTGVCQAGTRACTDGAWDQCSSMISTTAELCNGLDDNCDGQDDEGCICNDGDVESCGTDVGICSSGSRSCIGGQWSQCNGTMPTVERCNGVDDDCDGGIDESIVVACGISATPPCGLGVKVCVDGTLTACEGNTDPSLEICDGRDNDCDGVVDQNTCECSVGDSRQCAGSCGEGTQRCDGGQWGGCEASPSLESCNGVDDDCDGTVDEGLAQPCGTDLGACRSGQQVCNVGAWSACQNAIGPVEEVCDAIDNDCDGAVDDACVQGLGASAIITPRLNAVATCVAGDGCDESCTDDPDCVSAQLRLDVVALPEHLDIIDQAFTVDATVTNVGGFVLPNVIVDATASEGWDGQSVPLGAMDPNETRSVELTFNNVVCPGEGRPSRDLPRSVELSLDAHSGMIGDKDAITRAVRTPALGVLVAEREGSLRTCIVVGNEARPRNLEVELEVYDQTNDHIVDLVSPLRVKANETLITVRDYSLRNIEVPKVYRVRANMFENGSLFSPGYHVAEAHASIDLSHTSLPRSFSILDFVASFLEVFQ